MNDSISKITLSNIDFTNKDEDEIAKRVNGICELPKDQCQIESSDILNDFSQPQAQ
jgi:hypothetical protein